MIFENLLAYYWNVCSVYFKYRMEKNEFLIEKINHQDSSFKVYKI